MQTPPNVYGTVRPQVVYKVIRLRPFQNRKMPPDAAFVNRPILCGQYKKEACKG